MANEVYQSKYTAEEIEQKFDDVGSLNTQISSNISGLNSLCSELNSLTSENSTQESLLSSLSSSASELNSVASSLSEENSTQNSHLNSLSTENSNQTSEISSLSTDTSELDSEVSEISSEVDIINNGLNASIDYTGFDGPTIHTENGYGCIPCATILPLNRLDIPKGFLACDGSEYLKSTYPKLASILAALDTEYETTLYVGSDIDHFKVPDLRGEFIRGAGTNSHTNQGSGANVGVHQDGTQQTFFYAAGNEQASLYWSNNAGSAGGIRSTADYLGTKGTKFNNANRSGTDTAAIESYYISRPTNTSENMIIAYKDIYLSPRHEYSTEEHVVGTWIDGKPLYEKTIVIQSDFTASFEIDSNIDKVINMRALRDYTNAESIFPYLPDNVNNYNNFVLSGYFYKVDKKWHPQIGSTLASSITAMYYTFQYTKTTD